MLTALCEDEIAIRSVNREIMYRWMLFSCLFLKVMAFFVASSWSEIM